MQDELKSKPVDEVQDSSSFPYHTSQHNTDQGQLRFLLGKIFWTPPSCRYDPEHPPSFSLFQNILFALSGACTVANLYYPVAILNVIARDFDVSYLTVSRIPTLAQAGYAVGLFLICPLGDLFPRRPYTLCLVFLTATLW